MHFGMPYRTLPAKDWGSKLSVHISDVTVLDAMSLTQLRVNPHRGGGICIPEAFVHRLLATISALEGELELHRREAQIRKGIELANRIQD